jgi:hypothetical protein
MSTDSISPRLRPADPAYFAIQRPAYWNIVESSFAALGRA